MENSLINKAIKQVALAFLFMLVAVLAGFAQTSEKHEDIEKMMLYGDYTNALALVQKMLVKDSLNADLHFKMGMAYENLLHTDKARLAYEKAHYLNSNDKNITVTLAKNYYTSGWLPQASALFATALGNDSTDLSILNYLGRINVQRGRYKDAFHCFKKITTIDSTDSYAYQQAGYCAQKMSLNRVALSFYENAFRLNNKNINTILYLSSLYDEMEKADSCKSVLIAGLLLDSMHPAINRNMGNLLYKQREFEEATKHYERVVTMGDSTATVLRFLGLSYLFAEEYDYNEPAYRNLLKSFTKDSTSIIACYYLGIACGKTYRPDDGLMYLQRALAMSFPTNDEIAKSYREQGVIYLFKKDLPNYIEANKKQYEYKPNNELLVNIGTYYANLGDKKTSLSYLNKCKDQICDTSKFDCSNYIGLAQAYEKNGDKKNALYCFEKDLVWRTKYKGIIYTSESHFEFLEQKINRLKEDLHFEK